MVCLVTVFEMCVEARIRTTRALVAEPRARLLPLALSAPEIALVHAVHLTALLVVRARSPARAAGGPIRTR